MISFVASHKTSDYWTLEGTVKDKYPVAGLKVRFGGVLAEYGLTATVRADGSFSETEDLPVLKAGTATAQTHDVYGTPSNVAKDWVTGNTLSPVSSEVSKATDLTGTNAGGDTSALGASAAAQDLTVGGTKVNPAASTGGANPTAAVQMAGTSPVTQKLSDASDSPVTAPTFDVPNQPSNSAAGLVSTNDAAPVVSNLLATNTGSNAPAFAGDITEANSAWQSGMLPWLAIRVKTT